MHISRFSSLLAVTGALLLSGAHAWYCDTTVDGQRFDLTALDAEYRVLVSSHSTPPTVTNVTLALNPCRQLKVNRDLESQDQCPSGTQVCRTTSIIKGEVETITEVVTYAATNPGQKEEADVSLIEGEKKSGVSVKIFGGHDNEGKALSTRIDFICARSIDIGEPELVDSEGRLLVLSWSTKYACAGTLNKGGSGNSSSGGWGFFTWFFLIIFMAIAALLIFTLFLNVQRYGQVGLDPVPTMDSLRDLPYLAKDFANSVMDLIRGQGMGRSGYSAV
ncbi:hypothetical protein PYCC9005_000902 [Savitreella phatthalungensis]